MSDKSLSEKAIDIKGKKYVLVDDRVSFFNETYPNGYIQTTLISQPSDKMVVVKAKVVPDNKNESRYFTGYSQAIWGEGIVNKTAALENAETSAVGRALAFMGIGVIDSIASADEMVKAGATQQRPDSRPAYQVSRPETPRHETAQACKDCGAEMVNNPKTGKWFCSEKCWLTPVERQEEPEQYQQREDISEDIPF